MKKINLREIKERHRLSPNGKYERYIADISVAHGSNLDGSDLNTQHPFDLALVRIPPGKSLCPYHSHSAEWELYVVVSGVGTIRDKDGNTEVAAGDSFVFRPSEAHQLSNHGGEDFVYYVVANNAPSESCHYPDSGKWAVAVSGGEGLIIHGKEGDYFDGEE